MTKFVRPQFSIPISLDFITSYMPQANPTHVCVYLYGWSLSCAQEDFQIDNTSIAQALDILESDVVKAWKYWKKVGLIENEKGTIRFIIPEPKEAENIESSKEVKTKEPIKEASPQYSMEEISKRLKSDKNIKETMQMAEAILKKPLSQRELHSIYSFMEWYGLTSEVILMLLEYCVGEEKTNIAYIEKVAQSWSSEGVTTVDQAAKLLKRRQKEGSMLNKCKKMFGLERGFSNAETSHIVSWTSELGMSEPMIRLAYERTILNTGKLSFAYMNKILQTWHKNGLKTVNQVNEKEGSKTVAPKNTYSPKGNYDFDALAAKEREKMLKKK